MSDTAPDLFTVAGPDAVFAARLCAGMRLRARIVDGEGAAVLVSGGEEETARGAGGS